MLFFFFTLLVWYQSKPHEILLIWKLDALYLFAKFNPFQTKTIKIQWMTNYRKRFWFSIKKRRWSKSKSTRCMTKWEWRERESAVDGFAMCKVEQGRCGVLIWGRLEVKLGKLGLEFQQEQHTINIKWPLTVLTLHNMDLSQY